MNGVLFFKKKIMPDLYSLNKTSRLKVKLEPDISPDIETADIVKKTFENNEQSR